MTEIKLTAKRFERLYNPLAGEPKTSDFIDVSPRNFHVGQNLLLIDGGGSTRYIGVVVVSKKTYDDQGITVTWNP